MSAIVYITGHTRPYLHQDILADFVPIAHKEQWDLRAKWVDIYRCKYGLMYIFILLQTLLYVILASISYSVLINACSIIVDNLSLSFVVLVLTVAYERGLITV